MYSYRFSLLLNHLDWWRASDSQLHGAAALFPPLLGLPPLFTPPSLSQSHTPKKSTRGPAKGSLGPTRFCLKIIYPFFSKGICFFEDLLVPFMAQWCGEHDYKSPPVQA